MSTIFAADNFLPSYEDATSQNVIAIFAPYIRRNDVFACSLVSTRWNHSFRQVLWNKPSLYWELGERSALNGFERFIKRLPIASESSRDAVQILSLRDIHPTIYANISSLWLKNTFRLLKNLHTIIAGEVPFFDYNAILKTTSQEPIPRLDKLCYLDLSNLGNTNSRSLVDLFHRLTPSLLYLDLSRTTGAYHTDVLATIGEKLLQLKTLKLQDLQIDDAGIEILAKRVGVRLESLDVSGNCLTDSIVDVLLDWCFMPPEYEVNGPEDRAQITSTEHDNSSDIYQSMGESVEWITTSIARVEAGITNVNQQPPPGFNEAHRAAQAKGLTCLCVSRNKISAAGHAKLVRSTRLRTFDCGLFQPPNKATEIMDLVPVVNLYGSSNLRNLRIDFRIVFGLGYGGSSDTRASRPLSISMIPKLRNLALVGVPHTTYYETMIKHFRLFLNSLTTATCKSALSLLTLEFSDSSLADVKENDLLSFFHHDSATFNRATEDDFSFFDETPEVLNVSKIRTGHERDRASLDKDARKYDIVEEIRLWREETTQNSNRWSGTIRIKRNQ